MTTLYYHQPIDTSFDWFFYGAIPFTFLLLLIFGFMMGWEAGKQPKI